MEHVLPMRTSDRGLKESTNVEIAQVLIVTTSACLRNTTVTAVASMRIVGVIQTGHFRNLR